MSRPVMREFASRGQENDARPNAAEPERSRKVSEPKPRVVRSTCATVLGGDPVRWTGGLDRRVAARMARIETGTAGLPYTIRKQANGNFQMRGTWQGKRIERSVGPELEEAHRNAEAFWRQLTEGADPHVVRLKDAERLRDERLLGTVALALFARRKDLGKSRAALESERIRLRPLIAAFPTIDAMTTDSLERYTKARLREVTVESVKKDLQLVKRLLEQAQLDRLIKDLPRMPQPKQLSKGVRVAGKRSKAEGATAEEIADLLAAIPEKVGRSKFPLRAYLTLAWETGLRTCLLFGLQHGINWEPGENLLTITADIDKSRWPRKVPLTPGAIAALEEGWKWAATVKNPHALFFPNPDGTERSAITNLPRRVLKKAVVQVLGEERQAFNASSFRAARNTFLLQHGINGKRLTPEEVRYLLGHKTTAMQDLYTKVQVGSLLGRFDIAATKCEVGFGTGFEVVEESVEAVGAAGFEPTASAL